MKNHILFKVFLSIILAIAAGLITGPTMGIWGFTFLQVYGLIGQLFLNALTLVVVPLVASSIITGTARMGADGTIGTLGLKTFGYFLLNCGSAILIGLMLILLIQPGILQTHEVESLISFSPGFEIIKEEGMESGFQKFAEILFKIIPSNILAAAAQGQMLGVISFSLVFGYFISKIDAHSSSIMLGFWKAVFQIMMSITNFVMKALPIGVFGLVAKVAATTGLNAIRPIALFTFTVLLGLCIHAFVVLPLYLKLIGKVKPLKHLKAMGPALVTAFSTSSSAASLPITIECIEERAKVSNRICSFTVPLGTSLNLSGSSLFICTASLFLAQVYGVELSATNLFIVALVTLLSSMGVAGIPSACLIGVILVLHTLRLPAEAVGLILAVERILDMCRTSVSVWGNSCCAVLIARSEGEKDVLQG